MMVRLTGDIVDHVRRLAKIQEIYANNMKNWKAKY